MIKYGCLGERVPGSHLNKRMCSANCCVTLRKKICNLQNWFQFRSMNQDERKFPFLGDKELSRSYIPAQFVYFPNLPKLFSG